MQNLISFLQKQNINCVENDQISKRTTFRIGGVSALSVFVRSESELIETLAFLREREIPFEVIGNASNLLFAFERYEGVLIFTGGMDAVRREGDSLVCECGVMLPTLARRAAELGLSGLEFACGIPGTVGGGVFMNAGAHGGAISDVLVESVAYDCVVGERRILREHGFGYRTGIYAREHKLVCLGATFALRQDDPEAIRFRMNENLTARREKQPLSLPSAGSYFKRPPEGFAGKYIEDAGLKGVSVGGAYVSEKHAGFIVNKGGATAADVLALEELVRRRVEERFGVVLEREVRVIK